tara:strand:+ start:82 stop:909 length:828 start_codon:yes stop_codon:yes gene_type:complete
MNLGIVGQGFVGKAVFEKFRNFFSVLTYDLNSKICNSNIDEIKNKCGVVFVCVPTPMNHDGSCDISIVENVINEFSDVKGLIVINKSTVIPGTTDFFNSKFENIQVVFNPEFLTERNAILDYDNQDRIIIGGPRPASTTVKNIFSKVFPKSRIIKTGSTHAEMIKYFTNCFLATKVSFANEMFDLCQKLGLDYDKVIEYSSTDKRIGNTHLNVPGHDGDLGFGGHCFPKDLEAVLSLTEKLGSLNNVLRSVKKTNDKVRKNRDWEKMIGRAVNKN